MCFIVQKLREVELVEWPMVTLDRETPVKPVPRKMPSPHRGGCICPLCKPKLPVR